VTDFLNIVRAWFGDCGESLIQAGMKISISESPADGRSNEGIWISAEWQERGVELGVWESGDCDFYYGEGGAASVQTHRELTNDTDVREMLQVLSNALVHGLSGT
jgi:hypothetical protein